MEIFVFALLLATVSAFSSLPEQVICDGDRTLAQALAEGCNEVTGSLGNVKSHPGGPTCDNGGGILEDDGSARGDMDLPDLLKVHGRVYLNGIANITSLTIDNLQTVGEPCFNNWDGTFKVINNGNLVTMSMKSLVSVGFGFVVTNNTKLTSLYFNNLKEIGMGPGAEVIVSPKPTENCKMRGVLSMFCSSSANP